MSTSRPQASLLGAATELARTAGELLYSYHGSLRRRDASRPPTAICTRP